MSFVNFNPDPSFLADNIRNLRKHRNWSQEELAKHVGLNRGNIASYEKGTAEPKLCNLLKIAHLFEVSVLDLLRRDLKKEVNGNNHPQWSLNQEQWSRLVEHAEEIERVAEGIFHCHSFKMKQLNSEDKDVKALSNQFDQLYEATRALLKSHWELLSYLGKNEGLSPEEKETI